MEYHGISDDEKREMLQRQVGVGAGFGWGFVYGALCVVAALVYLPTAVQKVGASLTAFFHPENTSLNMGEAIVGLVLPPLWLMWLVLTAIAVFRRHKWCVPAVYGVAIAELLQVISRGIVPLELALWCCFNIPFIVYFHRHRTIFIEKKCNRDVQ